ncbi:uncharacterized protein LOC134437139 [Engraulis encrasicolus]|uniref:uncharacterized protein LOC134437139 n=1 Tax=Engraulis encrasicolus TaxID=184585 RepID=UPI002FD3DFC7
MRTRMDHAVGTTLVVLLLLQSTYTLSLSTDKRGGTSTASSAAKPPVRSAPAAPAAPAPAVPAPAAPSAPGAKPAPVPSAPGAKPAPAAPVPGAAGAAPTPRPASAFLGTKECLDRRFTHLTCSKVPCPTGRRCVAGKTECECEMQCPVVAANQSVCADDGKKYASACNVLAQNCKKVGRVRFSHPGADCTAANVFTTTLKTDKQIIEVKLPNTGTRALMCQNDRLNIVASHVICRHNVDKLAKISPSMKYEDALKFDARLPDVCVEVLCKGHEYSLAECKIGQPTKLKPNSHIAQIQCYKENPRYQVSGQNCEFQCANGRCIKLSNTCNGVNNCGDGSDEMCCKECRPGAFHCKSDVCIPYFARKDGVQDCLEGEDELALPDTAPPSAYLSSQECLNQKYTHLSCSKTTCPPGRRCVEGKAECECEIPLNCPSAAAQQTVCADDGTEYASACKINALTCTKVTAARFSHTGTKCSAASAFTTTLKTDKQIIEVKLPNTGTRALVCQNDRMNIATAHIVCRHKMDRLAKTAPNMKYADALKSDARLPDVCVDVLCKGHEYSLAECKIGQPTQLKPNTHIAQVQCYKDPNPQGQNCEFQCANGRCIKLSNTCNGVNNCGDGSDEMCCKECRSGAFHCKSDVCISDFALNDGVRDCLGGEDEAMVSTV